MKLFAVACLTGASAQYSGDGDRGAVVDSDYYNSYEYDDFGNKKNKNKNNFFGQKYSADDRATTGTDWAIALNCWPANIEADLLADPNHRQTAAGEEDAVTAGNRSPTTYPGQRYIKHGPQHVIGSFEVSARATALQDDTTLHTEDPVQRSGLGGLYQFGHDTYNNEFHNPDLDDNSTRGTRWTNYKQARHAGCLYEKSNWVYGHDTFDKVFLASYYQGYGDYDRAAATPTYHNAYEETSASLDNVRGAGEVEPVWWHFFNAHILPNNQGGAATVPVNNVLPSAAAFLQPDQQKSIPLVMANPAYEGLGYLNFVVEYKNKDKQVGDSYLEFIDSSPGTFTNVEAYQSVETYRKINDCTASAGQECAGWGNNLNSWQGVHGAYYYDLWMGSWLINMGRDNNAGTGGQEAERQWTIFPLKADGTSTTGDWSETVDGWSMDTYDRTADGATAWSTNYDLVVSSFPHNNLGKDFRFNLRLLMSIKDTGGDQPATSGFREDGTANNFFSYYFYKINKIQIDFPFNVAYALYHEGRGDGTTTTGTRIDSGIATEGKWWETLNQDADNHPGKGAGADYKKPLDGSTAENTNTFSSTNKGLDYQFMHRSAADDNKNIIPPVDLGTHAGPNGEFHRIRGYIKSEATLTNAPDWCDSNDDGRNIVLEQLCGKQFFIEGLMNTYDERRGQRGTYQEIWVQLQYAIGTDGRDGRTGCANGDASCDAANDPFQSPWPYNHFMASEIVKIIATCDLTDVNNANTCGPAGATGPGRPNDSYYGGK